MNRLFGPIPPSALHIVVDMQELFRSHPEWGTQSLTGIIPPTQRLLTARPDSAYFSRFIPAQSAAQANGTWQRFYRRWSSVTLDRLEPAQIEIVQELRPWARRVADKQVYSAWACAELRDAAIAAQTVILTGAETDVCVLSTAMDALQAGLRVILATDALTSSSQACHMKALEILYQRLDEQVEAATVDQILAAWQ
ncbi:cysteine hydrolase family protein [Dongia deserti]|uniref:cysteine hydrolase family protein n=1 Tax=Dongia deserti TaxID=2268030 RepID=UPI002547488C|nr:isochorismatase family cysteine hydrolase [Dongia deserti]